MKFEIPFDAKIVFSTNLQPETLGDEAFFRRIQSKILIPSITDEQFEEVLRRVAADHGIALTPDAPTHLRWMSRELGDGDLRPYLPGAVCRILASICTFEDLPLELNPPMIERIAHLYFTHTDDRDEDLPVSASERRPVSMHKAPVEPAAMFSRPDPVAPVDATAGSGAGAPDPVGGWTEKALAALRAETGDDRVAALAARADAPTGTEAEVPADPGAGSGVPATGASSWAVAADVTTSH
jgi:hypothetical protein